MKKKDINRPCRATAAVPLGGAVVRCSRDVVVRTMRAGLRAQLATLLREHASAAGTPAAPIGILRSLVDCRAYGMARLAVDNPSPAVLAGLVAEAAAEAPGVVQVLQFPVKNEERWFDDASLCGFDLRRIRDRLLEQSTPSCCGAWPRRWISGYGPMQGFEEVLRRGCLVSLDALTFLCGEAAGPWRRLAVPADTMHEVFDDDMVLELSALRVGASASRRGEKGLMAFVGEEGRELWRPADSLPLDVLLSLVEGLSARVPQTKGFRFMMP